MFLQRALKNMTEVKAGAEPIVREEQLMTLSDPMGWRNLGPMLDGSSTSNAMKVSTVSACVEIRTDSLGKMPFYLIDTNTKIRDKDHPLTNLLRVRPNEIMTPFIFKKLIETWRLMRGNAYVYISRDKRDGKIVSLLPLDPNLVTPVFNGDGKLKYLYQSKNDRYALDNNDVIHLKGFSDDGIIGTSVLQRASDSISKMREQENFEGKFYQNQAQPSGVLTVESSLSKESKDAIRAEWKEVHQGADNAFKIAVLDHGLSYSPISMTQADAQFVESKEISVADVARYFLVPLYKLQAGKQTYDSNEQNSIEYVKTTLSPTVKQYEEEFTYKCLFENEYSKGKEININMNAELRGDTASRGEWYRAMRNVGAYSVDEIRGYEDMPKVDGGNTRLAPLNSIPLEQIENYFEYLMSEGRVANQGGDVNN